MFAMLILALLFIFLRPPCRSLIVSRVHLPHQLPLSGDGLVVEVTNELPLISDKRGRMIGASGIPTIDRTFRDSNEEILFERILQRRTNPPPPQSKAWDSSLKPDVII